MNKKDIISKGRYHYPQPAGTVTADSYIFIRQNGKKVLLLRFINERQEELSEISFTLIKRAANGDELGRQTLTFDNMKARPSAPFVPGKGIIVAEECEDVEIFDIHARYGKFVYTPKEGGDIVDYVTPPLASGVEKASAKSLIGKIPVAVALLFSVLVVACACAIIVLYLNYFSRTQTSYSEDGVVYAFVDGDKTGASGLQVTGYTGSATSVVIPAYSNGYAVVSIAEDAFADNTDIRRIVIEGVQTIGQGAFSGCTSLSYVQAYSVEYISAEAFYGCTSLSSFASSSVTYIGSNAFYGCTSLMSAEISTSGDTVQIGTRAFSGCTSLRTINISAVAAFGSYVFESCTSVTSLYLADADGISSLTSLFGSDGSKLSLSAVYIEYMESIPSGFCRNISSLKSFTVNILGDAAMEAYVFYGCKNLSSLSLPEEISYVGSYAFYNCTSLGSINLAETLEYVGDYAFANCSSLTSVALSSNLSYLGSYAFSGCTGLASFPLSADCSLEYISAGAFYSCSSLAEVTIPYAVTYIGERAFYGCIDIQSVTFEGSDLTDIYDSAFYRCSSLADIAFPSSLAYIGDNAFRYCSSLSYVNFPSSLCYIGERAFCYCTSLVSADLSQCGNITVSSQAFNGCASLTQAVLPATACLYDEIFRGCSSLASLTVPLTDYSGALVNLGYYFTGSNSNLPSSLTELTVTGTYIADYAFYECTSLTAVTVADDVQYIGSYAFAWCTSLTSVTIPNSVERIGYASFIECNSLETLTLPFAGYSRYSETYIGYIFGGSMYSYNFLPSTLTTIVITDAYYIGDYCFYGCQYLQSVTISGNVTSIGRYAFYDCYSLTDVELPDTVNYIENYAFANCFSLTEFTVPASCISIGEYAFYGCYNLVTIYNYSSLSLSKGLTGYGYIAYYANQVINYGRNAD